LPFWFILALGFQWARRTRKTGCGSLNWIRVCSFLKYFPEADLGSELENATQREKWPEGCRRKYFYFLLLLVVVVVLKEFNK
jgi:hypothetical protein